MWLRYLGISFLNQVAQWTAFVITLRFILPDKTPLFLLNISMWALALLLSLFFAAWAFSGKLPTRLDALMLLVMRLLLAVTFWLAYGIFVSVRGPWAVVTPEILVQLGLEAAGVLIAAYIIRRRKIRSVLGEGMVA